MSVTWQWLLKLLVPLLGQLLNLVSPVILSELKAFLTQLYLKALETSNPWDDMLMGFLLDTLSIPRPSPPS